MLSVDEERVGSPPFESLTGQKHCRYEQGAGEGLLATRILLYPDSYKIGQIEPVLAATAAASNYAMKTV